MAEKLNKKTEEKLKFISLNKFLFFLSFIYVPALLM